MAGVKLTKTHINELVDAFSTRALETVLIFPEETGLEDEDIRDIRFQNPGEAKAQSRQMLKMWANKNSVNPVKTLAALLYKAAKGSGSVDPHKVQKIFGLTENQAYAPDGARGTGAPGGAAAYAPSSGEGRKLTAGMVRRLSNKITSNGELRNLGTLGLGVPEDTIDKHLHNERGDINEAALKVIKDWRKDNTDDQVAYRKMSEALIKAGLRGYISLVLEIDD